MSTQSIDLSSIQRVIKNGADVDSVSLNGTSRWSITTTSDPYTLGSSTTWAKANGNYVYRDGNYWRYNSTSGYYGKLASSFYGNANAGSYLVDPITGARQSDGMIYGTYTRYNNVSSTKNGCRGNSCTVYCSNGQGYIQYSYGTYAISIPWDNGTRTCVEQGYNGYNGFVNNSSCYATDNWVGFTLSAPCSEVVTDWH